MPEAKQHEVVTQIVERAKEQSRPIKEIVSECINKEIGEIEKQEKLQKLVFEAIKKVIRLVPDTEMCEAWLSDLDREAIEDELETVELAIKILTAFRDYAKSVLSRPIREVK